MDGPAFVVIYVLTCAIVFGACVVLPVFALVMWLRGGSTRGTCGASINLTGVYGAPKRRQPTQFCGLANTPEAHYDGLHQAPWLGRGTDTGCSWAVREDEPNYLPLQKQRTC